MSKRFLSLLLVLCLCTPLAQAATLDLTDGSCTTVDVISSAISTQPDVTEVNLTGVSLTWKQRKQLMTAHPKVNFRWTAQVYGVPLSSEDIDLDLTAVKKLNGLTELCDALDCFPQVKNVYMWNHQVNLNDRKMLHSRYPGVFFGWDMEVNAAHRFRTDVTEYSTLGRTPLLEKRHLVNFTFCPNLVALDIGHCFVQDISFLKDCNQLKILILADTGLRDISVLESQTDLEYLELFMNDITDISVLSKLTKLKDVNLAFCNISDLSPLYDLPDLERVWVMRNDKLTQEDFDEFRAHQPDCELVTHSWGATGNQYEKRNGEIYQFPGTSWRDHPHYDTVYYIFNGGTYIGWDEPIPADWTPPPGSLVYK